LALNWSSIPASISRDGEIDCNIRLSLDRFGTLVMGFKSPLPDRIFGG
jgi:hypothetical protein